jgi:phosphohistidine phosphatase
LKKRGDLDAIKIGQLVRNLDLVPSLILSSTAKRAKDTAIQFSESSRFDGKIVFSYELYHGCPSDYIDIIRNQGGYHNNIMVVGHNPGIEELILVFTDIDEWMPTGSLAQLQFDIDLWSDLTEFSKGKLVNIWFPRSLGRINE